MKSFWKPFASGVVSALAAVFLLAGIGDNVRRMFGASVNALASSAAPPTGADSRAHRNVTNFAGYASDEAMPSAPAPQPKAMEMAKKEALAEADAADGEGGAGERIQQLQMRRMHTIQVIKGTAEASGKDKGGESSLTAPTRSWFPESFLFAPLVVTDAAGRASLDVPVPDRLTSWRILALAHSREGAQAGAVTSFLGTLPAYVDPVVPPFLIAGDEVKLPIQLVNTTEHGISLPLKVDALGGALSGAGGSVSVGGGSSKVEYADLKTAKPGEVSLHAAFGDADAIARVIPVYPSGRAVTELRGGTLAAERSLKIDSAPDLLPDSTRARLLVFPGALGLLRSELSAASARGGVAADGYALLLAGKASGLLQSLGDQANPEVIRGLTLVAAQRALRDARRPDVATAALLGEAALAHPDNPVLSRLGERLVAQVAQSQRPDGTFEGGSGWTLQRLLVTTAQCVQMVRADQHDDRAKQRAASVTLKAQGAFERNLARIEDGYTAAAILASGAAPASAQPKLRKVVRDAVTTQADGSRVLVPKSSALRPDGAKPSTLEATALAALALDGDPEAPWRADLGSALLGGYSPGSGWGDGETNLVALRAVLALFKTPLPSSVQVTLAMDGKPVAQGELAGAKLKDVLALDANLADAAGSHTWTVSSNPAVPGLGFSLTVSGYVPWKPEPMNQGLELAIQQPSQAKVGEALAVEVTAAAPATEPVRIRHALPAGVEADKPSLDALVSQGLISSFHTEPGAVVLEVPVRAQPGPIHLAYKVIPTLGGTLHASASSIEAVTRRGSFHLPPMALAVK